MNALRTTEILSLAVAILENVGASAVENEVDNLQFSDSSASETSSLWSFFTSTARFAAAILVVLSVVVLLAVAWHQNTSISTAVRSVMSSVVDAVNRRRRCHRMPSHVRHRLRLRIPEASATGFDSCVVDGAVSQSMDDSPSLSAAWAPQMLSLYAKKQRLLQLARKDSGDCDAATSATNVGSRVLPSLLFAELSRQQTPRELSPADFEDVEMTFFNRRLELLADD